MGYADGFLVRVKTGRRVSGAFVPFVGLER